MTEPRNFLCLITSNRETENVDELTRNIWSHFDGICCVVHKQGGDDTVVRLLNERKGEGFVIERDFKWHHGHAMNEVLLDRRICLMDALWWRDSCERFNPVFTKNIRALSTSLLRQNIWNLAQYSKILMFRRWYNQQIFNGLHWGVGGLYGRTAAIESFPQFKNDRDCAYSVRSEKRASVHRYIHELQYLLNYGPNGNHLALFFPDPTQLDRAQWDLFAMTQYLAENGVTTVDQLIDWWKGNSPDIKMIHWINFCRPIRNAYRYFILYHTDEAITKDEDEWRLV